MAITNQPSSEQVPPKLPIVPGVNAGPVEDFEALLGEGTDLWVDDAEFEAFLLELRRWRRQDRDGSRPK